jgi:glycosyltransferase involved in cell wall biosynthesis
MGHKICFVGTEMTPSEGSTFVGGHVNTVVGLCKGLADLGWKIHIVTTPSRFLKNSEFNFSWAKFHVIPSSGKYNSLKYDFNYLLKTVQAIETIHKKEAFELVHGHSGYFGPSIIPALVRRKLRIPVLFSLYCPASILPRKLPIDGCGIRLLSLGLDRIVAVTANVKESLIKYGVNPKRIEVVRSCFDERAFARLACEKNGRKTAIEKAETRKILFVGNVEKTKGLDIFLDAADVVLSSKPDVKFIITLHEPEECLKRVKLLAYKRLGTSVEVFGVVTNMAQLMSSVDIVVAPFRSTEGISDIPIIVLEAMALGKPVVASNLAGVKEAIQHGENGIIIDLGNVAKLADALIELIDNPSLCETIGNRAASSVKDFSNSEISRRLSDLYLRLIEAA